MARRIIGACHDFGRERDLDLEDRVGSRRVQIADLAVVLIG
jgi:hypothetical protein